MDLVTVLPDPGGLINLLRPWVYVFAVLRWLMSCPSSVTDPVTIHGVWDSLF